jgi:hypothetical protein
MVMTEFDVLVDKCAKRLAEGKKPHRVTLNKMHTYPGTTAEFRMNKMDERYKFFRQQYLTAKPSYKKCLPVQCQVLVFGKRLVNQQHTI